MSHVQNNWLNKIDVGIAYAKTIWNASLPPPPVWEGQPLDEVT